MKKILFVLSALTLSIWGQAQTTFPIGNQAPQDYTLQELYVKPDISNFHKGDTVVIDKNCTVYLTGEKPSPWVYNVRHVIGQVGGKRFPNGILLGNIFSWIEPANLKISKNVPVEKPAEEPVVAPEETPAEEPVVAPVATPEVKPVEPIEEKPVVVPVAAPEETPAEEPVVAAVAVADTTGSTGITGVTDTIETTETTDTTESVDSTELYNGYGYLQDTIKPANQIDRFTIGARAGAASMLQKTVNDAKGHFGFDVLLDLQYAHYWIQKHDHKVGIIVGLSAGYVQNRLTADATHQQYTLTDPDGWKAQYDVKADNIRETDRQVQLEVPVMFSLLTHKGFFMNLGPRFFLPVYTPYLQKLENPNINAYFEYTDVTVSNEVITGLAKENDLLSKGKTNNELKLNITLGLELGYEWQLKHGNSLGLGAYANYGLYSMFKNDNASDQAPLIQVTPAIPSTVSVQAASDTWTQKMGFVDVGLKLAYHFNWWKAKSKENKKE